jgi:hypothetical protein
MMPGQRRLNGQRLANARKDFFAFGHTNWIEGNKENNDLLEKPLLCSLRLLLLE